VFVSATPPSDSAQTLLPKKNCQLPENSGVLLGDGVLHRRRPNHAPTLKKGQVDVFSLGVVSADNINVSARLITDIHKILGRPASCRLTKNSLSL